MSRYSINTGVGTTLCDSETGATLYFQPGDDETTFLSDYESLIPHWGEEEAIAEMWFRYA